MDMSTYTYEENGRNYIDPNVSLSEQQEFMKNLKEVQQQNNQQIYADTHNLGTDISSNLGGLTGAESYFTSRYQTPQTNALVADLRSAAQAQALNQALNNEIDKAKKRYNDAYRAAKRRAAAGDPNAQNPITGEVDETPSDDEEQLTYDENGLVLPKAHSTDVGAVNAANNMAGITGQGKVPTTSSMGGILVDKNGNRTAIKVYPGQGISVAGGMDYTKKGARDFLSNWVKNGGQVLNYLGRGNYSTNMITWDLY